MKKLLTLAAALLFAATLAFGQTSTTGTTTLSVGVLPEAAIQVNTATTTLTSPSLFANYTATTSLTYWIRTTPTTGAGSIVLKVTADFSPAVAGGPSVAYPRGGRRAHLYLHGQRSRDGLRGLTDRLNRLDDVCGYFRT